MKLLSSLLPLAALALSHEYQFPLDSPSQPLKLDAIPLLGFGTWNLKENCSEAVSWAIQAGYRHLDCAAAYGNEAEVGAGIRDGLRKTGLSREDLWITSKLWNDHHEPDRVEKGINDTLAKLGVGYLDLYHMHWPVGSDSGKNKISYLDTWDAMVELVKKGKARHLGVCNFDYDQLEKLLDHTAYPPVVRKSPSFPHLSPLTSNPQRSPKPPHQTNSKPTPTSPSPTSSNTTPSTPST